MSLNSLASLMQGFAVLAGLLLFVNDHSTNPNYQGIWVMPFSYVLTALILMGTRKFKSSKLDFTYAVLNFLFFIRLVITPLAIHFAGTDYRAQAYVSASAGDLWSAMLMISYESIAAATFFFFASMLISRTRSAPRPLNSSTLPLGSRAIYRIVAILGVGLIVVWGVPEGLLNFFEIREGTIESERSSLDMILIQFMIAGAWLAYLLTVSRQTLNYRRRSGLMPFVISLAAGLLLLLVIFGDRRSVQLYTAIAVSATLLAAFPDRKRAIIYSISTAAATVIATVSIWRMFSRHDMDFTFTALIGPSFFTTTATALQSYFGGPFQIAVANEILAGQGVDLSNFGYDLLRSTFGVNLFIDQNKLLTSQILNSEIYYGKFLNGWLVFTTSYGASTFGALFMPLFLVMNISLAMLCEHLFRSARGIETKFLFIYLFSRMALFPFTATPILLSFFSLQLFTIGLIFFAAIFLERIKRNGSRRNQSEFVILKKPT